MKITVIGCGRWGSFIAWYLDSIGNEVTLYGRDSSAAMQRFIESRSNGIITLADSVRLSSSLESAECSDVIVISINAQGLSSLMDELKALDLHGKTFVLCMKGIEISTGRRLSQIVSDNMDKSCKVAVWIGPGHPQEFVAGIPNCMVIDSDCGETKKFLVEAFSSKLIRFYYGNDLIGNEIGAATKNVIGIAAGFLDGLELTTLKGALMSRGTREVARLIDAMGGNELSAYVLCHLGDYQATVFSQFSHNRCYGEMFVRGKSFDKLAEGCYTVQAVMKLCDKYKVDMPICKAVYDCLYEKKDAREALDALFMRSIKTEF